MQLGELKFKLKSKLKNQALATMQKYPRLEIVAEKWLSFANNRRFSDYRYKRRPGYYNTLFREKLPQFQFASGVDIYVIVGSGIFCDLMSHYFGNLDDLIAVVQSKKLVVGEGARRKFCLGFANRKAIDQIVQECRMHDRKLHVIVDSSQFFKSEDSETNPDKVCCQIVDH